MSQQGTPVIFQSKNLLKAILLAGLVVGVLDITAAIANAYISNGTSPARVFRFIASGVFGREAFSGGLVMASFGLFFHFIIALGWTALFFVVYPKLPRLSKNKIVAGMAYGIFIWVMMHFIVVPLSRTPSMPFNISGAWKMILIHMFVIGVPISLFANTFYAKRN